MILGIDYYWVYPFKKGIKLERVRCWSLKFAICQGPNVFFFKATEPSWMQTGVEIGSFSWIKRNGDSWCGGGGGLLFGSAWQLSYYFHLATTWLVDWNALPLPSQTWMSQVFPWFLQVCWALISIVELLVSLEFPLNQSRLWSTSSWVAASCGHQCSASEPRIWVMRGSHSTGGWLWLLCFTFFRFGEPDFGFPCKPTRIQEPICSLNKRTFMGHLSKLQALGMSRPGFVWSGPA